MKSLYESILSSTRSGKAGILAVQPSGILTVYRTPDIKDYGLFDFKEIKKDLTTKYKNECNEFIKESGCVSLSHDSHCLLLIICCLIKRSDLPGIIKAEEKYDQDWFEEYFNKLLAPYLSRNTNLLYRRIMMEKSGSNDYKLRVYYSSKNQQGVVPIGEIEIIE